MFDALLIDRKGAREEIGTVDAARFVAHVSAVVPVVALAAAVDASAIAAFKLIGAAGGASWGAGGEKRVDA